MNRFCFCGVLICLLNSLLLHADEPTATKPAFPVKASANGRYLVDSEQVPFFYHADTPWMLFKLDHDAACNYLDIRKEQGFTALQIMLTGFMSSRNAAGEAPFHENDISRPNEAYFAYADKIIGEASDRGFLLAVAPLWSGCCGEGWVGTEKDGSPKPLNKVGVDGAYRYGRWLGDRYRKFPNMVWFMGGDHDPGDSINLIDAIARGIHETAPNQMMTAHNSPDHSSSDFYGDTAWLSLNAAYSYRELQAPVYREWNRETKTRPVFLSESGYEHEANDKRPGTPFRIRRQAYAAVLNGALVGHAYGNHDVWSFEPRWREALNDPGARQLKHVKTLFATRPWWTLVPNQSDKFITAGRGKIGEDGYVSVACSADGSLAIVYLPEGREVTADLSCLSGRSTAFWFDPTDGSTQTLGALSSKQQHHFQPPGKNASGDSDWILVIERSE